MSHRNGRLHPGWRHRKKYGFIGAGAVVSPNKVVGEAELWLGNPARLVRKLSDKEIESLHYSAQHYVQLKNRYLGLSTKTASTRLSGTKAT